MYKDEKYTGRGLTPTAAWHEGGGPCMNKKDMGRGLTPTAMRRRGGALWESQRQETRFECDANRCYTRLFPVERFRPGGEHGSPGSGEEESPLLSLRIRSLSVALGHISRVRWLGLTGESDDEF